MVRQVIHYCQTTHQIYFSTRRIEDTGIPTFIRFGGDIHQAFVYFPNHLRVDGDLLIQWAILGDGEVETLKKHVYLLKTRIGDGKRMICIQHVLSEQTTIEIRSLCQDTLDGIGEIAMSPMKLVVESFEEEYFQPVLKEHIFFMIRLPVTVPERTQKLFIAA